MESNKYMSQVSAWAFAVGTSIGWGSFFITSNTYLYSAGPLGSILGLLIGAFVMLFIAHNYQFMMNRYNDFGGVFTYTKEVCGHDYAFLVSSFLILTYFAMLWANATSLPLFSRNVFGNFFRFGLSYAIFGYQVFFRDALLSITAIVLTGLLCSKTNRISTLLLTIMVFVFVAGIVVCSTTSFCAHDSSFSYKPLFTPSGSDLSQILKIAFISPWAFIGFENISHFVPEFKFPTKKSGSILRIAVITTTILYSALILLSVTAYPPKYANWFAYIQDLPNIKDVHGLPAFYAATRYMGDSGFYILMLSLLALILTSLIGNVYALSRLIYSLGENKVVPEFWAKVKSHMPTRAIWGIVAVSVIVPFFGRTAIGWIVDVTTIGATIVYGFLSFSVFKLARSESKKLETFTGLFGLAMMLTFFASLIIPNFFSKGTLSSQSFFLFSLWAILGFARFHSLLKHDKERIYGRSNIVWVFLLLLILLLTIIWMLQTDRHAVENGVDKLHSYLHQLVLQNDRLSSDEAYLALSVKLAFKEVFSANIQTTFVVIAFFLVTSLMILSNTFIIEKREIEHEHEIFKARSVAFKDSLTGVKSKHAYVEYESKLNQELAEHVTSEFSVVVCDVNNLKWVNDNLGHKAGDEYIQNACHLICVIFDHSPVFRTGGDEFVVILKGYDYEHRAELLGELNKASEENNGQNGKVVIAAGISNFDTTKDSSVIEVFERADANMYVRKKELKAMVK